MADIINILPDRVANQIAAGEVVQRPASVVKELMENAIDAGSTSVSLNIKDAGRTLIQVIDNGCGMSETDARLSLERHATSKIKHVDDLYAIKTMGFRGEALASIAAVSKISIKTKRVEDETGTFIEVEGAELTKQEPVGCANGSIFSVKNIFYNVPARRKFLKKDSTELRHIINEFHRVSLTNKDIAFTFIHNNTEIYNLPITNQKQRIIDLFGKNFKQNLIPIASETNLVNISGFIGKPEFAKKKFGEQFFFVNNRYMRNPYLHKSVMNAYAQLLRPETYPSYFIYLNIDPATIDVNIHPTKTEVKFEQEQAIWQILEAATKQALGKNNIMPAIDFNTDGMIDIPIRKNEEEIMPPKVKINPGYNPFEKDNHQSHGFNRQNTFDWEKLYAGFAQDKKEQPREEQPPLPAEDSQTPAATKFLQFKNRYILTPVKSGLMIIDQQRARERINYEKMIAGIDHNLGISQKQLYPQSIELNSSDYQILKGLQDELKGIGFEAEDFGKNTVVVNAVPAMFTADDPKTIIETLINDVKNKDIEPEKSTRDMLAQSMASACSKNFVKTLSHEEMRELVDELFACKIPNYNPHGNKIITIFQTEEIEKIF